MRSRLPLIVSRRGPSFRDRAGYHMPRSGGPTTLRAARQRPPNIPHHGAVPVNPPSAALSLPEHQPCLPYCPLLLPHLTHPMISMLGCVAAIGCLTHHAVSRCSASGPEQEGLTPRSPALPLPHRLPVPSPWPLGADCVVRALWLSGFCGMALGDGPGLSTAQQPVVFNSNDPHRGQLGANSTEHM